MCFLGNEYHPQTTESSYLTPALDFAELFAYNFASERPLDGEPRPPLDTIEEIRIIVMEVRMTKIDAPGPGDNPSLPVVHFSGMSHSTHEPWDPNANSNIRGLLFDLPFPLTPFGFESR